MDRTRRYFVLLSISAMMVLGSLDSFPTAMAAGNQITLEELGVLQLAAHDLFNVDRGDRVNADTATDFDNGKLDLSTLFVDMTTGEAFSLSDIAKGGEPRNRENIILFSVASRIGQDYVQDINDGLDEQTARQNALDNYHARFHSAYLSAFGESEHHSEYGCVTMTENLAFRTVHDFLPGTIQLDVDNNGIDSDDPSFGIFSFIPPFDDTGLTDAELQQLTSMLDGTFDPVFTEPLFIEIEPGVTIDIPSLLEADTNFAIQFQTDFDFPYFLAELEDGSYDHDDEVMKQIRSLVAKGYGGGCYVGGEIVPIEQTSLLLAGAQSTTWIVPIVLSLVGIALVLRRK